MWYLEKASDLSLFLIVPLLEPCGMGNSGPGPDEVARMPAPPPHLSQNICNNRVEGNSIFNYAEAEVTEIAGQI